MFKNTLIYILTLAISFVMATSNVHANGFTDPLSIHPQNVRAGQEFLIHINSVWNDGCRGEIITEITSDTIDLTADPFGRVAGAICPQVLVPFHDLINPYDTVSSDFRFADNVTINFSFIDNNGQKSLISSKTLSFSDEVNVTKSAENGFWVSTELANSSLTIDQQGDVISLALSDFEEDGKSLWYFAAGPVNGDIFIGTMFSYDSDVVCVTEPCPRAVTAKDGRVYMLINDRNEVIAKYIGLLDRNLFGDDITVAYERLELQANTALPKDPIAIPDLTGQWIAGIESSADIAEFAKYTIGYGGEARDSATGLTNYIFSADITNKFTLEPAADFTISCIDMRPLDGGLECRIKGLDYRNNDCDISFPFTAVANDTVTATAICSNSFVDEQIQFVMHRRKQ